MSHPYSLCNTEYIKGLPPSPFSLFKEALAGHLIIKKSNFHTIQPYEIFDSSNWTYLIQELKNNTHKEYMLQKK